MNAAFLLLIGLSVFILLFYSSYSNGYKRGSKQGIDKTFKNKDVVSVLFAYMIEQQRHEDTFSLRCAYQIVQEEAKIEILSSAKEIPSRLYERAMSPEEIMHILVFNIIDRDLRTGRYHSEKGVLSDKGIFINILWGHTLSILCKRGLWDRAVYEDTRSNMARAIAKAG